MMRFSDAKMISSVFSRMVVIVLPRAGDGPAAIVTQTHITMKAVVSTMRQAHIEACQELVLTPPLLKTFMMFFGTQKQRVASRLRPPPTLGSGVPHPRHLQINAAGKLTMLMTRYVIVAKKEVVLANMFVKDLQSAFAVLPPTNAQHPPILKEALIAGARKSLVSRGTGSSKLEEEEEGAGVLLVIAAVMYLTGDQQNRIS